MTIDELKQLRGALAYSETLNSGDTLDLVNLIDAEIERQEPCDACNNGDHGTTFKVDIEFGKRLSLTMHYCPTCGRKMQDRT